MIIFEHCKNINRDNLWIYLLIALIIIYFVMHSVSFFFKIPVIIILLIILVLWYKSNPTKKIKDV